MSLLPRTCPLNCMSPPISSCQLRTTMHLNMAVDQLGLARHTSQTTRRPLPLIIYLFARRTRHPLGPLASADRRGSGGATHDTCASLSVQARFVLCMCTPATMRILYVSLQKTLQSKEGTIFVFCGPKTDLIIFILVNNVYLYIAHASCSDERKCH